MKIYEDENNKTYKKQSKVAFMIFLSEVPNFFVILANAITSRSLLVWADLVDSVKNGIHDATVWLVTRKIYKDNGDSYNYGAGRLEVFTSFICDVLVFIGFTILFVVSIFGLISPVKPEESIIWYAVLKCINLTFDLWFLITQINIYKKTQSPVAKTEIAHGKFCSFMDVFYLISALICYFFKDAVWTPYLSPSLTIIVTLYFAYGCQKRIRANFFELVDKSVTIKDQDELYDIVLKNCSDIKRINSVNCHVLKEKLHIDLDVTFKKDYTVENAKELLKKIDSQIEEKYPGAITNFIISDEN